MNINELKYAIKELEQEKAKSTFPFLPFSNIVIPLEFAKEIVSEIELLNKQIRELESQKSNVSKLWCNKSVDTKELAKEVCDMIAKSLNYRN